ncbi:membrane metalloprotease [Nonlabens antarcticus]|uniref:membrane metalloprotease n=1 Tax=Nonlabens antarcticus TaxID=392714 RepID=UPI001890E118|nr:membrane metalloprotease [Nonlabens antarcticus]
MRKYGFWLAIAFLIVGCASDDSNDVVDGPGNNGNANLRNTGDSAEELLRSDNFDQLEVELIYVNGARPETTSINNLKSFLQARLNKPNGINIVERNVTNDAGDDYSIEEVSDLENSSRTSFSRDQTIAVSVLFVDKPNDGDEGNSVVLGSAYRNTSLVIYQSTIERFSRSVNQPSRVDLESTVYNHEFGHLLGLVNLGTPLQSQHEDAENDRHCNVDGCLMFFQINGGNILDMMNMTSIPQLDPQCIADLQANGGK